MTGNDRKRPQDLPSVLPPGGMDSTEIPRFSPHFPRKFPDFPRFSLKFSEILRFSLIFSDNFPNFAVFYLIIYIIRYGKKRIYELGEARKASPNNSYLPRIGNIISRMSCDIRRVIAPISMEIKPTIKVHKVILLFILFSCSFFDFSDLLTFTASVSR